LLWGAKKIPPLYPVSTEPVTANFNTIFKEIKWNE
jgi:hypothetical protein